MKKFISTVLLVLVEASVADVDTVEFKLGGYKIQVPLNRHIHVNRVKSASLADLPVSRLAGLLTSAAHSATAPLPAPPEPRPRRPPPTNRYLDELQQTTYLEPHPPNSFFPSPNATIHHFPKQQPLPYDREQHSVSYYEKHHHGIHTPKNSFPPPRPDQFYHVAPPSLSINNRYSTSPNVEYLDYLLPNNRYPATEHSENNKYPILHSADRNYPESYPPHRNPETLAANQHHAPSYSPNDTYPTPSYHRPQPESINRPEPEIRNAEYSSQRMNPLQQPQSSRTRLIKPRATQQAFPAWLRLPADPGLAERVTPTEPFVSTTDPVSKTIVPDVPMTTAEHVTSTTEPLTIAAVSSTEEFKSTTQPVITTPVPDVLLTTGEHVTSTAEQAIPAALPSTEESKLTAVPVVTTAASDVTVTTADHVTSTTEPVITTALPSTEEFKTTDPVITTAVSDVTMTTYDHVTSTTEPVITVAVPSTEEFTSTTDPVITTAVSDETVTTADHVTSTTELVTTAAMSSTEEFKSTTEPVITTAMSDVTMATAEHVTSSFKEFIHVHNLVLGPDVVTTAINQVASPFKDFTPVTVPVTKVSAQGITETAAKRMSLPKNITSEPVAIKKIDQMTLYEPTSARSDPVTTPVPAVTTNTATKVIEKEVFSHPVVFKLAATQMTSQTEQFNNISIPAKTKDLIMIATEADSCTGTTTSDTITLQATLPPPSTVTFGLMAPEPQTPSTPKRNPSASDPALLLAILVQHIPTTFATMITFSTPPSITNSIETFTEPSTAAALMSAIDLKNTLKGSAVTRGVTAPPLRAARATRAMRVTRAPPGAATLVSCVRVPRKSRSSRKRNRGRKAGPAQRHGGTRAARARALPKRPRPPRARSTPTAYPPPPRTRHVPATYSPRTRHATATDPPRTITR